LDLEIWVFIGLGNGSENFTHGLARIFTERIVWYW